jgi:hypothetical protein
MFCPNEPFTTGEFIHLVDVLDRQKSGNRAVDTAALHRDVFGQDNQPVTRGDAATILYNNQESLLGMN